MALIDRRNIKQAKKKRVPPKIFTYTAKPKKGIKPPKPFNVIAEDRVLADLGAGVDQRKRISFQVKEVKGADASFQLFWEAKQMGTENRITFYSYLAQFTRGGKQTTPDALLYVAPMMGKPFLRGMVAKLATVVRDGKNLSEAMQEVGGFSEFEIAQTQISEKTGQTAEIADALADFFEQRRKAFAYVQRAIFIPIVSIALALIAYLVLGLKVLPQFEKLYASNGGLPFLGAAVKNVAEFIAGLWHVCLVGVIALVLMKNQIMGALWKQDAIQKIAVRVPAVGSIYTMVTLGSSFDALAVMTRSGMTLTNSYEFLDKMLTHCEFKQYFSTIRKNAEAGYGTGDSFFEVSSVIPMANEGDRIASIMAATETLGDPSLSVTNLAQEYRRVVDDFLLGVEKRVMVAGTVTAILLALPALIGTAQCIVNLSQVVRSGL